MDAVDANSYDTTGCQTFMLLGQCMLSACGTTALTMPSLWDLAREDAAVELPQARAKTVCSQTPSERTYAYRRQKRRYQRQCRKRMVNKAALAMICLHERLQHSIPGAQSRLYTEQVRRTCSDGQQANRQHARDNSPLAARLAY
eukprot:6477972-Amphidinium_carterae.1